MCGGKQQPKLRRDAAAAARLHPEFSGCWVISASRSKIDKESVSLASPFHCCRACELQAPKKPWCDLSGRENSQGKRLWKSLAVTHCCVLSVTVLSSVLPSAPDGRCDRIPPNRAALCFCVFRCLTFEPTLFLCQTVRCRWPRWELMSEVGGVLRSAHQQVEHVCIHVQKERGRGRGHLQQLPLCRGRTWRPRLQPLLSTLWLRGEVGVCVSGGGVRHRMTKWFESAVKITHYRGGDGTLDSWILPPLFLCYRAFSRLPQRGLILQYLAPSAGHSLILERSLKLVHSKQRYSL